MPKPPYCFSSFFIFSKVPINNAVSFFSQIIQAIYNALLFLKNSQYIMDIFILHY